MGNRRGRRAHRLRTPRLDEFEHRAWIAAANRRWPAARMGQPQPSDTYRRRRAGRCHDDSRSSRRSTDFRSEQDDWPHLYAVSAYGGAARLLTPGADMIEDTVMTPDRGAVIYSANTGSTPGDDDRRHLFRVDVATGRISAAHDRREQRMESRCARRRRRVRSRDGAAAAARHAPRERRPSRARRRSASGRLSLVATRHAARSLISRRRRAPDSRAALSPERRRQAPRHHLRARRAAAADAVDVALHGLLLERVRRESVPGESRLRRALGELSPRHRLRPRLQLPGALGADRGFGVPRRRSGSALLAARFAASIRRTSEFGAARTAAISRRSRSRATRTSSRPAWIFTACTTGRSTSTTRLGRADASATSNTTNEAIMRRRGTPHPMRQSRRGTRRCCLIQGRRRSQRRVPPDGRFGRAFTPHARSISSQIVIPNEIHGFLRYASWLRSRRSDGRITSSSNCN